MTKVVGAWRCCQLDVIAHTCAVVAPCRSAPEENRWPSSVRHRVGGRLCEASGARTRPNERRATVGLSGCGHRAPNHSLRKRPNTLSLVEKTTLLKSMGLPGPGTVYVTLSPSRPEVANRAALAFERPRILDGGEGYAWWRLRDPDTSSADFAALQTLEGTGLKRLGIWFKSFESCSSLESAMPWKLHRVGCRILESPPGVRNPHPRFAGARTQSAP